MKDTFNSTNTLRGIAISVVLINHYLNRNVSGDYLGFATQWISLFFIVSGFGVYKSLENHLIINEKLRLNNLHKFYAVRLVRIFPLYWAAYIGQQMLLDREIDVFTLLGIYGSGHFWFIPAILQCYLVSPLIFALMYINRLWTLIAVLASYILVNTCALLGLFPDYLTTTMNVVHLNWNQVYFFYIFVFSLSMFLPTCIENWGVIARSEKRYYMTLIVLLIIAYMIVAKWRGEASFLYDHFVFTLIPLTLLGVMSIYLLSNDFHVRILSWLGERSYSIYLFHIIYFLLINIVFQYRRDSVVELIVTLALLPVFLAFCSLTTLVDRNVSEVVRKRLITGPVQH